MPRQKNGHVHRDRLVPSDRDTVALGQAVQTRFLDLLGSWERIMHEQLTPPPHLDSAMILWRQMCLRHRKGDFRNTESELKAVKEIAQWTIDMNDLLRNQGTHQPIEWKD